MDGRGLASVQQTLALRPRFAGFRAERAVVEAQTRFDDHRGGPRNHDLLVVGSAQREHVVVSVEAKADETFGATIEEYRSAAQHKVDAGTATKALDRLMGLMHAIAGSDAPTREGAFAAKGLLR
jgi:hypothetical protein